MKIGRAGVFALLSSWLMACAPRAATPPSDRTVVAVFAHPDDETIVGAALARLARDGARVQLVTATDGRLGANDWARIPAGDSLAVVRAAETRCAARALGIAPPLLLGFPDAGLAVLSPWPGEPLDRLATRLDSVLRALRPDVVITWGPEGGYGHQDHRLVGDVVTQLFQAGAAPGAQLFFAGFPVERTSSAPRWYGHRLYPTAPALLTAGVSIDARDRAAAREALACHRSQATRAEMDESVSALEHLWQDRIGFRPWGGGARRTSLF